MNQKKSIIKSIGSFFAWIGKDLKEIGVTFAKGSWQTRLSFLLIGFGQLVRKQFARGLAVLAAAVGLLYYIFGFGMSYVDFTFGSAKLSRSSVKAGQGVTVTVPVTNNGSMAADEVVQVYVKSLDNPDAPIKSLKAYQRVNVAPGKTVKVKLTLDPDAFAYYSESVDDLAVFPGRYQILYGNSSADKDLQSIDFRVL